jgi:hypothetical protein
MTTEPADGDLVPLGGAPHVLAGVDPATGAAYAVKVLPGPLDRRTRAALDAELRTLAGLRDRAPILSADEVRELGDGRWALRMELCSQSLPELIDSFGPLSVPDAVALGAALAEALTAAHGAGLPHGAVTPGNVLFRSSGEPVLADFGRTLRRAFPADPARTMDFLAPESVRDGTMDERSDLYGLGGVLFLALTGRSPHAGPLGEAADDRLLRVLHEPAPPVRREDVPPALTDLIATLLAKDPADRPPGAAWVVARLDALPGAGPGTGVDAGTGAGPGARPGAGTGPGTGAGGRDPGGQGEPPADTPRPRGEPILVFGPRRRSRWLPRPKVLAAAAAVAVAGLLFWLNRPDDLEMPAMPEPGASPAAAAPSATRPAVLLELADPTDRGNVVDLAWRSSEPLNYAIVVAAEGEPSQIILAQLATSYSVPVDPVRKYCFKVQGTNGVDVYGTAPKPIRGAVCRE